MSIESFILRIFVEFCVKSLIKINNLKSNPCIIYEN